MTEVDDYDDDKAEDWRPSKKHVIYYDDEDYDAVEEYIAVTLGKNKGKCNLKGKTSMDSR